MAEEGGGERNIARRSAASGDVELFATWFCPYAQRAWIALEHKQVPYAWRECVLYEGDPSTKVPLPLPKKGEASPPGFLEASPRGLVPGLRHGEQRACDSIPLVEYIDEAFCEPGAPPLLPPGDPAERARVRAGVLLWAELVIRKYYSLLMAQDEGARAEQRNALYEGLRTMADSYFDARGPFFSAAGFGYFEACALPWYQRMHVVLGAYRKFELPEGPAFDRLREWHKACLGVPAFANTVVSEERLVRNNTGYADGTGTSNCAQLMVGKKPS